MAIRVLRAVFVGAAVSWAAALFAATWIASQPHLARAVYLASAGVYVFASALCHQRPERSFQLWGSQMPVCARCAGIYLGAAVAVLWSAARGLQPSAGRSPKGLALQAIIVGSLPSAATLVYEWTTGIVPSNWTRAAAGFPLGLAVAWVVRNAIRPEVN